MKIATLGIPDDGSKDFSSDLGYETKIAADVVPNMRRAPKTAWL